jgi:hypothetical protein
VVQIVVDTVQILVDVVQILLDVVCVIFWSMWCEMCWMLCELTTGG